MELEYKPLHGFESFGSAAGTIGIKILVSVNREFTRDENYLASSLADQLYKRLLRNSKLLDPEKLEQIRDEKSKLSACFKEPIYIEETPSEYSKDDLTPWLIVTTSRGRIKIGWRKRVINIDWSNSDIKAYGSEIFPEQAANRYCTVNDYSIHANGYEEAAKYVNMIMNYSPRNQGEWIDIKDKLPELDWPVKCICVRDNGQEYVREMSRYEQYWSYRTDNDYCITTTPPLAWRNK